MNDTHSTGLKTRPKTRIETWLSTLVLGLLSVLLSLGATAALALTTTTTTLTSSASTSNVGQSVTLTAKLSPTAATGTVTFKDGATTLGTGTLASGKATLAVAFTSAGSHSLTAVYAGNTTYATSTSAAKTQTVNLISTTTTLASGTNPSTVGQSVTLTATLSPTAATGTVTFKDGSTTLGTGTLSAGKATLSTAFSTSGSHSLTAVYAGNTTYKTSTSSAKTQTVNAQTATSTTLTSGTNPSNVGQSSTLTATVTPSTATGSVSFKDGATTLGSATLSAGKATLSTSFSSAGSHSLTAVYAGNTANATSTSTALSQTVNAVLAASTTTLTSSAGTGNSVAAAQSFSLTASVSPSSATGTITFKDGSTTLGTASLSAGTASLDTRLLTVGTHSLTAVYAGDAATAASTATAISQTVTQAVTDTALSATPAIVTSGNVVTLTVAITGAAPTGSVSFQDGSTPLGSVNLSAGPNGTGLATLSQVLSAGVHQLSASYAGDANNLASTSNTTSVDVSTGAVSSAPGPMTWQYGYDPEGNRWIDVNPLGKQTTRVFDSLARPIQIANPGSSGQPGPTLIDQAYNGQDRLTQVVDPRNLATTYNLDGLGNLQTLASPDTGSTSQTVDAAGNVLTRTDARGAITTYSYDALNRMTSASYSGSLGSGLSSSPATVFEWDGGTNPNPAPYSKGRLTKITDESGSTAYTYDALGRVLTKTQTVTQTVNGSAVTKTFTLTATWGDANSPAGSQGSLTSLTYPSGNRVNYTYDTAGRLTALSLSPVNANGQGTSTATQTLLSAITYNGANDITGWTWANGQLYQRGYDSLGRLGSYPLGNPNGAGTAAGLLRTLGYDDAGRITSYTHTQAGVAQSAYDQTFGYDDLGQLMSASQGGTSYGYAYDANGNRTLRAIGATSYPQTIAPTSNRLTQSQDFNGITNLAYDNAGKLLADRNASYTYSARGRQAQARIGSGSSLVNYLYNGQEQRVAKAGALVPTGAAYYAYDEAGQLLGEYDANLSPVYETVYLGATPVAVVKLTGTAASSTLAASTYKVWSDHIATPRVIARATDDAIVWRWDLSEAFGVNAPDGNPSGLGAFTYNQRFPGQTFDAETGNFYNWHRDYSPSAGRYTTPDPLGLAAGSMSLYSYVNGSPLMLADPSGLQAALTPWGPMPMPPVVMPTTDGGRGNGGYDPRTDTYTPSGTNSNNDSCCSSYTDVYEANDGKHGSLPRGDISAEPSLPGFALQNSVGVGKSRIGYDGFSGQIVIFRLTRIDEQKCIKYWHGYVVYQRDLTPEQWKAGRDAGFPNWPRKPK